MAKPGDVVAFRSGLHGLNEPRNVGILLARERRKGIPWVRIMTDTGALDIKQEHLLRRVFRDRFDGRLQDEAEVQARVRQLIRQNTDGGLAEEVEDDLGALEEALWQACSDGVPRRDDDIAKAHYEDPSPLQLKQVRDALERCRRPGIGRFEATDKGDVWRAWSQEERERMQAAWDALARLKAKLVVAEETDEGRVYRPVPLTDAGLDDADQATLDWVEAAMVQFIEHDGVPDRGIAGIGGLGATKAFGMDLHRQLGFLAGDWIRSDPTTRSSDYVHFLLESGRWRPDDAVQSLMRRHVNQEPFFEHVPDDEAEARAQELPEPDLSQDPDREDLRHLECFTIDPPDAKDFDDAVGLQPGAGNDGADRLWVHIADVSHYVTQGSRLDKHAKDRATSVYLPGRVLPMLPHRIADHLCSLRDDGDRFAMSVNLDIDATGRVQDAGMHVAMIRVDENLSYDDAMQRRDAGDARFQALFDLAKRMRSHRRGLDIDMGEIRVSLEEGLFSATEKRGNDATRMIETFMVAANEAVAKFLADRDIGLLYRCHPLPDASKAERFVHQLETIGLDVDIELPKAGGTKEAAEQSMLDLLKSGGGKLTLGGGGAFAEMPDEPEPEPEDAAVKGFASMDDDEREAWLRPFRDATHAIATLGQKTGEVASLKMLGCMGQAYYTPENEGHFGLGSTHYCHFTSPIRRYPDLVVHRNLKAHLRGEELPHPQEDLQRMCDHCSDQERAAADLERRVKSACLVLASLDGEQQVVARITGIIPAGLFVRRDDGIEARIGARDLPGGPYAVDEWESMLYLSDREAPQRFDAESLKELGEWYDEDLGERRRVRAKLADHVQIALAGRDVADGKTSARLLAWR